ncbi:hypothetical protein [Paenibacillus alvei]|uniref:hypothetical protein n=1 Tax=Paenibacillus alvei TaxID=44250 RepID=UPI0018CCD927|nr:hypothetical protein [Paenibacillus alvei]MBG9736287.1 hypothetical protein [Paenibacillus alvei]MBG9747111.1 hypothetical protein [Paenibacillus alvei]MCY9583058.1 hypothetical protein [Paenibacillus alvei]MCY9587360.1 hypothetical protein [Paenibacillus alvei]
MRNLFTRSNKAIPTRPTVTFGVDRDEPKTVQIRKITVAQWQELFGSIQTIPQLIISIMSVPETERAGFFMVVLGESLENIVQITSILTGLDVEYLRQNAAADELFEFYSETVKMNNFGELLKNGRSVLGVVMPKLLTKTQDAN